jgi:hypothetical protein
MIESEPSYGGANSLVKYYDQLEQNGLLDPNSRKTNPQQVFGDDAAELAKASIPIETMKRIREDTQTKYNEVVNGDKARYNLKIPNGPSYSFMYDEDKGFYLDNWKERGFTRQDRPENLSFDEFLNFLDRVDYWMQWAAPENIKKTTGETEAQKALREYRERNKK